MDVKVSRKDIFTGYIAQIFNYGTGVIVLPVILNNLTAEEIGMNYVMLSVGALSYMVDFGFSGQIGRNLTYVLSGARKIYRGEIEKTVHDNSIDFKLLRTIIDASKYLYKRLSLGVLLLLLTLGTFYMYRVTDGFTNVDNSLPIWILFSIGVYFNIYFLYYNSLLTGAGLVMEQKLATIYSRVTYIVLCFVLIFTGYGLMSVVIANLISPFVARYYSYLKFYSKEMKENLPKEKSDKKEVKTAISDIWATAKKSGTNTIGHYIGTQGSTFLAGAYLPLAVTAQWGLMIQLMGVVQGLAANMGQSFYPEYCKLRLQGNEDAFLKKTSLSIAIMISILVFGGLAVIALCPWLLQIIGSQTQLPPIALMCAYLIYLIIVTNAQLFAMMMTSRNVIPSPVAVLITSVSQLFLTVILLQFFNIGVWGLLLGPFIAGISHNLWKWAQLELSNMKISALQFYRIGFKEIIVYASVLLSKIGGDNRDKL